MNRLIAAAAVALLSALPVAAHEARTGDVTVVHPLLRASIGKTPNTAGYMTVRNSGRTPDRLLSVSCACARKVEVHTMTTTGGRMVMRPAGPVALPAGGEVAFKPFGLHLMLTGLRAPIEAGVTQELTLTFEKAGVLKAPFFATARVDEEMNAHRGGHHH